MTKLYLARRFTAEQNFPDFVRLTPRFGQTKISPSFWSITAFSGCRGITQTAPDRGACVPLREPRFYPQKYGAFSANSAIVSRSMSRLRIKQTSTPSGSQPLTLRARHLPLPQGTALMMTALSARHFVLSLCAHTQQITELAAKPRDFRMERHVSEAGVALAVAAKVPCGDSET